MMIKKLKDMLKQENTWEEGVFPFHTYIPYEAYYGEHDVYSYEGNVGWVCEIMPFPGAPETLQKDIQALLEEILPEGLLCKL